MNILTDKAKNKTVLRRLLLGIAVILIVVGLAAKDYVDVLGKAVMICRECIGLG